MSHWQVKHESASASRLQKHEISCMKHFPDFASVSRKSFMKVQETFMKLQEVVYGRSIYCNNQWEGNLRVRHSFHDRARNFHL